MNRQILSKRDGILDIKLNVKKLSQIWAVILIFALSVAIYAVPVTALSPVIFKESADIQNDTVLYRIEISENSNISGLTLEVNYPQEIMKLSTCNFGGIMDGGISKSNTKAEGKVIISYISMTPLTDSGTMIELEFTVISTESEKLDVRCTISECIDKNCDELDFTYEKSEIKNPLYSTVENGQNNVGQSDKNQTVSTTTSGDKKPVVSDTNSPPSEHDTPEQTVTVIVPSIEDDTDNKQDPQIQPAETEYNENADDKDNNSVLTSTSKSQENNAGSEVTPISTSSTDSEGTTVITDDEVTTASTNTPSTEDRPQANNPIVIIVVCVFSVILIFSAIMLLKNKFTIRRKGQ